ncbi:MAG: hypothetical protein KDD56_10940, partial [Bdellovibrionales bacterium]|nr:hypothetical protein [Bdellovibrionales bacterium]
MVAKSAQKIMENSDLVNGLQEIAFRSGAYSEGVESKIATAILAKSTEGTEILADIAREGGSSSGLALSELMK